MVKKTIKLKETDLHKIIKESVNNVIKEHSRDIDDDNYYGGGLPDRYFDDDDDKPSVEDYFEGTAEWDKITNYIDAHYQIEDLEYEDVKKLLSPINSSLSKIYMVMNHAMESLKFDGLKHEHIVKYMRETFYGYSSLINDINRLYNKYKWLITDK